MVVDVNDVTFIDGAGLRSPRSRPSPRDARIAATVAALLGTEELRLHHDHVLVKEAGTRQTTPWHQDQPYYNVDGSQGVSVAPGRPGARGRLARGRRWVPTRDRG